MKRTRDARRGGVGTNNFSSVKRKNKQPGMPKFLSEGKLNNGGVKTMVKLGKASSRYKDRKMTCLMSDIDVHADDDNVTPCNNKKIIHKVVDDCNSTVHTPVPRKLRSAMKNRNQESLSPPFQDSETVKDTIGESESPKAIHVSTKTSKMDMSQGDHITKDEEEVVETLFSLASMFSTVDTPDTTKHESKISEEIHSLSGVAGDSSMPAFAATKYNADSARPTTIDETCNPSYVNGTSNDENLSKTFVPQKPSLAVYETFPRVDLQAMGLQSCNFGVLPQQNRGSGLLDWSKQFTDRKPMIELNPPLNSVIQQDQRHSTFEAQKGGRAPWPGLFPSGAQINNLPLQSAAATQYPSWLDTPKPLVRPSSYQNVVSNEKALSDAAERKSWKRCATHVHIGCLIKDLNNSERNDIKLSEPNHIRPSEGLKQENLVFGVNVNKFNGVISGGSAVEINLNEARNESLLSQGLHQDQHYTAAVQPGACNLQKPTFDFLSLYTGGGGHATESINRSSEGKNGLDSFTQLPTPYYNLHNQYTRPVSLPQTRYSTSTSGYGDQLSAASAKQASLHVPVYRGIQYSATAQTPPCSTKFQQEQVMQQMWAAQMGYKPSGLTSNTVPQLPPRKNGRYESSSSLVPCAANNTIVSTSLTPLGGQGSLKYTPFSSQQEQFMAMTSSLGHAGVRRQQHPSFLPGHEKHGGDFSAADNVFHTTRFLHREHL